MTWDELKEEAKKMGAFIEDSYNLRDVVIFLDSIGYTHRGLIITWGKDDWKMIANSRTPDQMFAIMKALQ